jgi:phthalate 4,5-cis-dihydrodiol dehydrogenase
MRTLKMAVLGVGQGAAAILPTVNALPEYDLVAIADVNPRMRQRAADRYPGVRVYESSAQLADDKDVEVVWIATPNKFHCANAVEMLSRGKHVLVEKPMAITLAEADQMVDTAAANKLHLVAAHTSSYGIPVRAMRKLALTSDVGRVRAILVWSFTDWMLRGRTPEELSPEAGAGIVHRQAPHQIDVVRLLGGGKLRSVRGTMAHWMPERPIPGFYTAYLEFEDGTPATIFLNGYGYFMTGALFDTSLRDHRYRDGDRVKIRKALRTHSRDEEAEKEAYRLGGTSDPTQGAQVAHMHTWAPIDLGMLVTSCEHGEMRHSPHGIYIHGDEGQLDMDLRGVGRQEFDLELGATLGALGEMYDAVVKGAPVFHSGAWGRATLEATIGIVQSAQERREIMLERQVAMHPDYDKDMVLPAPVAVEEDVLAGLAAPPKQAAAAR